MGNQNIISSNSIQMNKYITYNSTNLDLLFSNSNPFIDLTVTSPPYWDAKEYGKVNQTGFKQTYEEYLGDLRQTFQAVYNLSKSTASLYVISDTLKRNGKLIRIPDDIVKVLEEIGWQLRDVIIWDKGKTLPWSRKGQLRNTFEYIHFFTKSNEYKYNIDQIKIVDENKEWWVDYPERYSPQGKVPENIWRYIIPTQGSWGTKKKFGEEEFRHACPFPPKMMARILRLSSDENDVVFDPYAGTGVFLATAESMDRRYLGTDTNPQYKEVFEKVTKPLIKEQMISIKEEYENQDQLKLLMEDTILKLRVLKFPKALIKKVNKKVKTLNGHFVIASTVLKTISQEVKDREEKIGEAEIKLLWNNDATLEEARKIVEEISSAAPFTKYGLIINIEVVNRAEFLAYSSIQDFNWNLYEKGIVHTVTRPISNNEIRDAILNGRYLQFISKDIPPIVSDIKIQAEDYKSLHGKRKDETLFDFAD